MRLGSLRPTALLLAVALLAAPLTAAAGGFVLQEFGANFEDGTVPAGWRAQAGSWAGYSLQWDPATAHGGNFALRQFIEPVATYNTGSSLGFKLPSGGDIFELEGWFYVDSAYNWGMTTTVFVLGCGPSATLGMQASTNTGGTLGYYGFYTGTGSASVWNVDFPQQAWHNIRVRYDRRAKTEDLYVDGNPVLQGQAVDTGALAATDATVYVAGGWGVGNAISQYLDDVVVRVWTEDVIAPTVKSTDPANLALNVPKTKVISVTFSEAIVPGASLSGVKLLNGKTTVPSASSVNGSVLTITPSQALPGSTAITVSIPAGAVNDAYNNALAAPYTFKFTTAR